MPARMMPAPTSLFRTAVFWRRLRRLASLVLLALVFGAAAFAPAAHAHAVLVEAQPADGAALAQAPAEILLRFNEPVTPVALRLLDADARRFSDGAELVVADTTLRLPLRLPLPTGTYVVSYRVTSADSHPVYGSITFTVGPVVEAAQTMSPAAGSGWTIAYAVLRALFLASVLIAAGGFLAALVLTRSAETGGRAITGSVLAGLALSFPLLGAKGAQLVDASAWGLLEWTSWRVAFQSTVAASLGTAVAGLLLLVIAMRLTAALARASAGLLGSALVAVSFTLTGHAASVAPRWLTASALLVHVAGAAFWLGALWPLLRALRRDTEPRSALVLTRFTTAALPVVALLLAAGLALAAVQLRHVAMLWQSGYGVLLAAKLALVIALLALAALNRFSLTPRLLRTGDAGPLLASIAAEYALFATILAVTAALTQLEPPRVRVERDSVALSAGRADFVETRQHGDYRITLSVAPARTGHNAFAVKVQRRGGVAASVKDVALLFSLPTAGIEPIRRPMVREPSGDFVYHSSDLAIAGAWQVQAQVLIDDFTEGAVTFTLPLR